MAYGRGRRARGARLKGDDPQQSQTDGIPAVLTAFQRAGVRTRSPYADAALFLGR
ncbi:hypothetical protein ACFXKS_04565 [Streptomyces scopuliridis]|uniref:hypothetical protein n=1 Tax=Streptomyces scopuliridis TaxID=452529 RepID=UPI0036974A40